MALAETPSGARPDALTPSAAGRVTGQPADPTRAFLEQHCVACHNDRARTAGLSLAGATPADAGANSGRWENVLHKVRTGQMPPAGRPTPEPGIAQACGHSSTRAPTRLIQRLADRGADVNVANRLGATR